MLKNYVALLQKLSLLTPTIAKLIFALYLCVVILPNMCVNSNIFYNPIYFRHRLNPMATISYYGVEDSPLNAYDCYAVRHAFKTYFACENDDEIIRNSKLNLPNGTSIPLYIASKCGKCVECREEYRSEITARATIEGANSGTVFMFTFTYDNQHLPKNGLEKKHVSDAFKRLRIHISRYCPNLSDIDFTTLYCGEYGVNPNRTLRPHYHGLIFVRQFLTPSQIKEFSDFFSLYNSKLNRFLPSVFYSKPEFTHLTPTWFHGGVDLKVTDNNVASARYITKYISKQLKWTNPNEQLLVKRESLNAHQNTPFVQMPKSIGLGCRYLPLYVDSILKSNNPKILVRSIQDGKVYEVRIPKIFIEKVVNSPKMPENYQLDLQIANSVYRVLQRKYKYMTDEDICRMSIIEPFMEDVLVLTHERTKSIVDTRARRAFAYLRDLSISEQIDYLYSIRATLEDAVRTLQLRIECENLKRQIMDLKYLDKPDSVANERSAYMRISLHRENALNNYKANDEHIIETTW